MWGRILQIVLAAWIAMSPFILDYGDRAMLAVVATPLCAAVVALLAALSFRQKWRYIHIASAFPALCLTGMAFVLSYPAPPLYQSNLICGLLLLIVVLVPTDAAVPPRAWTDFQQREHPGGTAKAEDRT